MDARKTAEEIFLAGVRSVMPSYLIPSRVAVRDNTLIAGNHRFPLDMVNDIFIVGAGKASALMAAGIENILGNRIKAGHIITKYGHACKLNYAEITEAGHPVPDENSFKGTNSLTELVSRAGSGDLVICLISGGGSALLADHPEGCTPEDIKKVNDLLVNSGACISEINSVRKHLSNVKGGQLARLVYPATLVSLILSDVPGDPLDVIASGPTAPDSTTFEQALSVLTKYNLLTEVPQSILDYLQSGCEGLIPETPDEEDTIFKKVTNILIGTNSLALEACRQKAFEYNLNAVIVDNELQGDTSSVAEYMVEIASGFLADQNEVKPVCLLFGGETTVKMTGSGMGGRNQHLALQVAMLLQNKQGITFLSSGTDGNDGNTEVAGAVSDWLTLVTAERKNIDPAAFLENFDSYHFFKKAGGHIITGPTMTNVMDLMVLIIENEA